MEPVAVRNCGGSVHVLGNAMSGECCPLDITGGIAGLHLDQRWCRRQAGMVASPMLLSDASNPLISRGISTGPLRLRGGARQSTSRRPSPPKRRKTPPSSRRSSDSTSRSHTSASPQSTGSKALTKKKAIARTDSTLGLDAAMEAIHVLDNDDELAVVPRGAKGPDKLSSDTDADIILEGEDEVTTVAEATQRGSISFTRKDRPTYLSLGIVLRRAEESASAL